MIRWLTKKERVERVEEDKVVLYTSILDWTPESKLLEILDSSYQTKIMYEDLEVTLIIPKWIYNVQADIWNTLDPLTKESREWIKNLDGNDLIYNLTCMDRDVAQYKRNIQTTLDTLYQISVESEIPKSELLGLLPCCTAIRIEGKLHDGITDQDIYEILKLESL